MSVGHLRKYSLCFYFSQKCHHVKFQRNMRRVHVLFFFRISELSSAFLLLTATTCVLVMSLIRAFYGALISHEQDLLR